MNPTTGTRLEGRTAGRAGHLDRSATAESAARLDPDPRPRPRGPALLLIALFLLALWLPRLQMTFRMFPSADVHENRRAAEAPQATILGFPQYLRNYARYFTDNFGLRGTLLRADAAVRLKLLQASPVSRLIFGRDGWIFYNSDVVPDGITISDFRGLAAYTRDELDSVIECLERRDRWCRERGIFCLFVIAPNKETVYPEYLPASVRRIGRTTRLDQIVSAAGRHPSIRLLDLRAPLLEAKASTSIPIYHRGGTHWTQYGAYVGYRAIMAALRPGFAELRPHDLDAYEITLDDASSEDHWLELKENTSVRFRLKTNLRPGEIPKGVVIHDSFWAQLEDFFTPHFGTLIAQRADPNVENSREILERERPDVVIYEIVERYADRVLRQKGF